MAGIILREPRELDRIMALRGLHADEHGPRQFDFRNDAFATHQGARVHQDDEDRRFCVTALLGDGQWVETENTTRMGEEELLFYLEHLLPFAKAALLVDGDAVNAVCNLWVMATAGIPGLEWSVFNNGVYAADRAVFEVRGPGRRALIIGCYPGNQWDALKFRVERGWNDPFEFVYQRCADDMMRMYDLLDEQFGDHDDAMVLASPALAVLERAVAVLRDGA